MSELAAPRLWSRREWLRATALVLTSAGALDHRGAAIAHALVQEARVDGFEPAYFKPHEWQTLVRLVDLILPADSVSGSAIDAGAPEFIDLLCSESEELGRIFSGGMLWLDNEVRRRHSTRFVSATTSSHDMPPSSMSIAGTL